MSELLRGLSSADVRAAEGFHRVEADTSVIESIKGDLGQDIYGQDRAIDQLARAVSRSWGGFSDPNRPEMVGVFLGPTGVGKTETAKSLAKFLHPKDWQDHFLRIDCTQLQESHSVGRLKGTEPGYVGYGDQNILITPKFLKKKDTVILFDEVEKASPAVWRWLLPVFEEGQQKALTPVGGAGRGYSSELATLDFSGSYIVMTANVGAEALHKARNGEQGIGFHMADSKPDMTQIGLKELKKAFAGMPEFLGRIDATVVFEELERPQYERIFYKFMGEINADQRRGANFLAATRELRDFVLDHAETGEYGAREIRHKINQHIVDPASEIKFSGVLKEGQMLVGDLEDGEVIFWTSDVEEAPKQPILPVVREISKKKDPGQSIGNRPTVRQEETPPEEEAPPEDGEGEEIDEDLPIKSNRPKNLTFYVPMEPGITIDLSIQVHQPGKKDLRQVVEGLPLV